MTSQHSTSTAADGRTIARLTGLASPQAPTMSGPPPLPTPLVVEVPAEWAEQLLRLIDEAKSRPRPVEAVATSGGVLGFLVAGFEGDDPAPRFVSERIGPYSSLSAARAAAEEEQRLEDRLGLNRPHGAGPRVVMRPLALVEVAS